MATFMDDAHLLFVLEAPPWKDRVARRKSAWKKKMNNVFEGRRFFLQQSPRRTHEGNRGKTGLFDPDGGKKKLDSLQVFRRLGCCSARWHFFLLVLDVPPAVRASSALS